ncbi:MAG: DUF4959 domain-containing protein [Bacteroidales bacterium]|jgi:hypothetical protein|nr:DUF4959 domain-containing protein [Bacteroidales bacterium]
MKYKLQNIMKTISIRAIALSLFILLFACKEEGRIDHIDSSAPAPDNVTVLDVTPRPGGSVIKYKLPDDVSNLLGVEVVYTRNGETCRSKASKYSDTLVVEGFGNTDPQEVMLYSVGLNGKLSSGVPRLITPLAPPVQTVQFDIVAGFGGVVTSIEGNTSKADLSLVLLIADTLYTDFYSEIQTFHTKSAAFKFSRRGLEARESNFAMFLRDRWGNRSDTIYRTLTPIEEVELPKTEIVRGNLAGDFYSYAEGNNGYRVELMFDGNKNGTFWASAHTGPIPQVVSFDLGHKVSISRFEKYPRSNYELYSGTAPRVFELWGSIDPGPDKANGDWDDSWQLLGRFEQSKPSGYGEGSNVGTITDEDKDYWYNHTEFELVPTDEAPDPYQTVNWIRLKILSTFSTYGTDTNMSQVIIAELTFWGQLKDDE